MTAIVKIVDDNGNPKGVYELKPSRICDGGIFTKYVFEFEYNVSNVLVPNVLNDKYKAEKGGE